MIRRVEAAIGLSLVLCACMATTIPSPSQTPPALTSPAQPAIPSVDPVPATTATAQVERVWIEDPSLFVQVPNEMTVDGDRALTVGVDLAHPSRHEEIESTLRAALPPGSVIAWPSDRRLTVLVPPGGPFTIDLSGSVAAAGSTLTSLVFRIDRPTYEVALYSPNDVLTGTVTPRGAWTVHLALQMVEAFSPDRHHVLVYHGILPRRSDYSLLDLSTGATTDLAEPFMRMAANGHSLMGWLPDGRLLGVGHATSFVGTADGQRPVELAGLVGQGAVLAPSRHVLALWSYAESTAAILDLDTGVIRALPGAFPRCTVGGIVAISWVDEDRVAISDCTEDLGGMTRTRVLSARTGATLETRLGDQLVATLRGGVELRARIAPAAAMTSPQVEEWLADAAGHVIARLPPAHYIVSPDGNALAYADLERDMSVLIDPASGRQREISGRAMTWTSQGELVVMRRAP